MGLRRTTRSFRLMPICLGGVGVLFLLLITTGAILTDSLRIPFSVAYISFSDMKHDDTKTPFSCTTVVHDKPTNALPPSFPDSTTYPAPANHHRKLLVDRKPSPQLPPCLPDC